MSGKIRNILLVLTCILIVSGCQYSMVPARYNTAPGEIRKNITGSWITVSVTPAPSIDTITVLSGELLSFEKDTFYILTARTGLVSLNSTRVSSAKLYLFYHTNLGLFGFLGLTPNIIGAISQSSWGGGFLILGIPLFVTSLIMSLENYTQGNATIVYPRKHSLDQFSQYARYPQGLPPGLEREKLHLLTK